MPNNMAVSICKPAVNGGSMTLTTCRVAAANPPDLPQGAFARSRTGGPNTGRGSKSFRVPTLQSSKASAANCSVPDRSKSMLKRWRHGLNSSKGL
jgi:hypothetical protein